MYSKTVHGFVDEDEAAVFGVQAGIVLSNAQAFWAAQQLANDLEIALVSRADIEQAKGIIIGARRCSPRRRLRLTGEAVATREPQTSRCRQGDRPQRGRRPEPDFSRRAVDGTSHPTAGQRNGVAIGLVIVLALASARITAVTVLAFDLTVRVFDDQLEPLTFGRSTRSTHGVGLARVNA